MELAGEYTFDGPQDIVWDAVRDPDVLGSILPGGEGISEIAPNEYEGKLKIKVGPVQGKFKGNIKLLNIVEPDSYDIEVDGKGAPGFVKAGGTLNLNGQGDKTLITYSGKARVGGRIASVGQRLLEASAKAIVNQSLAALNEYIKVQVERKAVIDAGGDPDAPAPAVEEAPAAATTTVTETIVEEVTEEVAAVAEPAPKTYTPPPPQMPEYTPPSQTELALNVASEVFDDLVPKQLQPVVLSVVTTLLTMFIVRLFSRKK